MAVLTEVSVGSTTQNSYRRIMSQTISLRGYRPFTHNIAYAQNGMVY